MKSITIFATLMILLTANYSESQTTMGFTFGTSFAKATFQSKTVYPLLQKLSRDLPEACILMFRWHPVLACNQH